MNAESTRKIYLWSADRSLGTVLLKCLSSTKDVVIFNGLFTAAYFVGPEAQRPMRKPRKDDVTRLTSSFPNSFDDDLYTYQWAKEHLEAPYPGKTVIYRDQAYALCERYDLLPPNFHHTFIIRHPHKSIPSVKKEFMDCNGLDQSLSMNEIASKYYAPRYGYGELHDLIFHLLDKRQHVVILDADDLQKNPESILRQYCQAVQIPFQESYLKWKSGVQLLRRWNISKITLYYGIDDECGYYSTAIKSTEFLPPKPVPSRQDLPNDTLEIIDSVMPYYQRIYEMRIRP